LRKLLIAESNKNDIAFYESLFLNRNYRVLIATNARESLKKYKSELEQARIGINIRTIDLSRSQDYTQDERELPQQRKRRSERQGFSSTRLRTAVIIPFDAVILNHRVSDTDGIEVAKEILSVNPYQRVVFVSESIKYTSELRREFRRTVDIIQKPFTPEALVELLESSEIYRALGSLGINIQKIKESNLYHYQLYDLLTVCMSMLDEDTNKEKKKKRAASDERWRNSED
jgi:CheY-like chemotaxis protein